MYNKVGQHSKKLVNELLRGELQKCLRKSDISDSVRWERMNDVISQSVSLYHNIWGSYFENSTWLDMYIIFSMKKFKKEVKNVNETNFWAQQEKISSITSIMMLYLRLNILRQKVKLLHQLPMVIKKILYMNWKHIKGMFSETILETILKLDKIGPHKML